MADQAGKRYLMDAWAFDCPAPPRARAASTPAGRSRRMISPASSIPQKHAATSSTPSAARSCRRRSTRATVIRTGRTRSGPSSHFARSYTFSSSSTIFSALNAAAHSLRPRLRHGPTLGVMSHHPQDRLASFARSPRGTSLPVCPSPSTSPVPSQSYATGHTPQSSACGTVRGRPSR